MNLQQCLAAADEIEKKYLIPRGAIVERSETGRNLSHLRWMIQEMRSYGPQNESKAMRWLGFIQGSLVWNYYCSLDDMKKLSERHFDGA
jgi:hypothetical protein